MENTVIVALLSCAGTVLGSGLGVVASSKLTNFRIEQLEKKVDKHNTVIERVYNLEEKHAVHEQEYKNLKEKIKELERKEAV